MQRYPSKHTTMLSDPVSVVPTLHGLQPGQQCIYHQGFLSIDLQNEDKFDEFQRMNMRHIAKHAQDLADEGKVVLTQRKMWDLLTGEPYYQYIATGAYKRKSYELPPYPSKKSQVAGCLR